MSHLKGLSFHKLGAKISKACEPATMVDWLHAQKVPKLHFDQIYPQFFPRVCTTRRQQNSGLLIGDVLVPREFGGSLADRGKWSPGREVASRWQHRLNPSCLCRAQRAGGVPGLAAGLPLAGSGGTEHFIQTEHSPLKRNANKII